MELFRYRHLALGCAGYIVGLYVSYFYLGTISRLIFLAVSLICFFALFIAYFITKKMLEYFQHLFFFYNYLNTTIYYKKYI